MMRRTRNEDSLHCYSSSSTKPLPKSPVNVVDFTRLVDFHHQAQSCLPTALFARRSRLDQPVAIARAIEAALKDSVKTEPCSTDNEEEDDDDEVLSFSSSLSSHSCHDEDDLDHGFEIQTSANSRREEDRRSIFSHYWKTTGQEPLELIREHSQNLSRSPRNVHLSLLDKETCPTPVSPKSPSSPQRRAIFGLPSSEGLSSMRSLPEMSAIPSSLERLEGTRKTRSASCLQQQVKRLPSCLRKSSERSTTTSSSSVVSFDAKVQVITFETPIENWSDGSWTDIFGRH